MSANTGSYWKPKLSVFINSCENSWNKSQWPVSVFEWINQYVHEELSTPSHNLHFFTHAQWTGLCLHSFVESVRRPISMTLSYTWRRLQCIIRRVCLQYTKKNTITQWIPLQLFKYTPNYWKGTKILFIRTYR